MKLPLRLVGLPISNENSFIPSLIPNLDSSQIEDFDGAAPVSLQQLGILESESIRNKDRFPVIKAKGTLQQAIAVCEMVALLQKVPFRRDLIQKILEDQFRRDKSLSLELLGGLTEALGLRTQLGSVNNKFIGSIEAPVILLVQDTPVVLFDIDPNHAIVGDPKTGLQEYTLVQFQALLEEKVRFALPRRVGSSPTSRFGWGWFTPLLSKYKRSLVLVFVASLLAQLFGLGIPLLIQQIIDKVLTQGNLSSLNVLGTVMIVLAVFQGFLLVLRTYIFVDTTDRMDLTLGSAVIDRLLALPLGFFEKRPVGELSQRVGELNTIRGFLTGTALVSVLNIIFAALYLVVMIIYSPLLTIVSLSTLPLYLLLVFELHLCMGVSYENVL